MDGAEQVMSDPISAATEAALKHIQSTDDLGSIESALNIVKAASEIKKLEADRLNLEEDSRKTAVDAQLSATQTRNASRTALAALLVPAASLLTVVATLIAAGWQVRSSNERSANEAVAAREAAKEAREAADWAAFEAILDKGAPDALYESPTFTARLRSFAMSGRYDQQLLDITKKFMIKLTSASAFQDIWKIAFKEAGDNNIDSIVEIARIKTDISDIRSKCQSESSRIKFTTMPADPWGVEWGLCSSAVTLDYFKTQVKDPKDQDSAWKLHQEVYNRGNVLSFVGNQVAAYLRRNSSKATGSRPLDLSNVRLLWGDFENVDFSSVNLTGTVFDGAFVRGAILRSTVTQAATTTFVGTPWWDAEAIDLPLLNTLIGSSYPGSGVLPGGYDISYDQYVNNVQRLCQNKLRICAKECLRYKTMPFSNAPECRPTVSFHSQ
jgi:hypothetical protein